MPAADISAGYLSRPCGYDGNTVTVAEGLRQGDRVAINLPDEITEGAKVQPILKK